LEDKLGLVEEMDIWNCILGDFVGFREKDPGCAILVGTLAPNGGTNQTLTETPGGSELDLNSGEVILHSCPEGTISVGKSRKYRERSKEKVHPPLSWVYSMGGGAGWRNLRFGLGMGKKKLCTNVYRRKNLRHHEGH